MNTNEYFNDRGDTRSKGIRVDLMTLRQYAAIKLRVPDSGTDWLDDMIRTSNRNKLASLAMQGSIAAGWTTTERVAENSFAQADAMIAEGEK